MTVDAALTCRELVELVTDYLDGRLPDAEAARFRAHLDECDGCAMYVEQFRATVAALGELPQESLSPAAERALLTAFRDWKRGR